MSDTDTATRPTSADLRGQLLEAGDRLREMRTRPEADRSDNFAAELRTQARVLDALDAEFTATRAAEAHEMAQLAWEHAIANPPSRSTGPDAATGDHRDRRPSDIGARVTGSEEYRAWVDGGAKGPMPEIRALVDSDTTTETDGNAGMLIPLGQPIPPVPRQQKMVMRDLIPSTTTTLNNINYVREYTPATDETGASSVAEAAVKPEVVLEFSDQDAPVRKIAAWVPVTHEILADAPTLRGYINGRLAYMVNYREQDEIIRGNGIAPDLTGIINTTGVQTQSATNNDVPGTIADSIAKVEIADGDANGVVMNPGDFWASVSERRSTWMDASGIGSAPVGTPAPTLWGLPVVRTRAMATLTALVADFANSLMIFDRQGMTIRETDSHDAYFIYNKVAILAEKRLALACFRPDLIVNTTVDITA